VDIDRAVVNPEATPAPGVPYLEIVVEETPRKGKPAGPIKLSRSGQGRDLGESYVRFDMEVRLMRPNEEKDFEAPRQFSA